MFHQEICEVELFDNSLKMGGPSVHVSMSQSSGNASLTVGGESIGPGCLAEERQSIVERCSWWP